MMNKAIHTKRYTKKRTPLGVRFRGADDRNLPSRRLSLQANTLSQHVHSNKITRVERHAPSARFPCGNANKICKPNFVRFCLLHQYKRHRKGTLNKPNDRNLPFPTSGSPSARFPNGNATKICKQILLRFFTPHHAKTHP